MKRMALQKRINNLTVNSTVLFCKDETDKIEKVSQLISLRTELAKELPEFVKIDGKFISKDVYESILRIAVSDFRSIFISKENDTVTGK